MFLYSIVLRALVIISDYFVLHCSQGIIEGESFLVFHCSRDVIASKRFSWKSAVFSYTIVYGELATGEQFRIFHCSQSVRGSRVFPSSLCIRDSKLFSYIILTLHVSDRSSHLRRTGQLDLTRSHS